MNTIDDSTLEVIAELVCGSGEGGGGGYQSPGPYRTKGEINSFFSRAGVNPQGLSSTRKWYALESLQAINGTDALRRTLLRLASPREYPRDLQMAREVIDYLNNLLRVEGLEVELVGVEPCLRRREPTAAISREESFAVEAAPNFGSLVGDASLADILSSRWQEAQRCVRGEAYLAAVVMMGSILEGVLLHKIESNPAEANRANSSPKDPRSQKPRPFGDWSLSNMIDVSHELGWLHGDRRRFSHSLRESRNLVHPYMEKLLSERPDKDTCSICWQVVRASVSDLLAID